MTEDGVDPSEALLISLSSEGNELDLRRSTEVAKGEQGIITIAKQLAYVWVK